MKKALPISFRKPEKQPDLLIIAGEHSGDEHAGRLVSRLLKSDPELHIWALGGRHVKEAGAHLHFDLTQYSVVGAFEVLRYLDVFTHLLELTEKWISEYRPKVVCFVDYPGFNFEIAKRLFKQGVSVKGGGNVYLLHYISPQIWAWKPKRRFKMEKLLDSVGAIFPFEVACYSDTSLDVHFVGHPFTAPEYKLPLEYDATAPVLLLPGSRRTPVMRILPALLNGFMRYRETHPDETAIVIYPDDMIKGVEESILSWIPDWKRFITLVSNKEHIRAKAVMTSSGTMQLTCSLAGIPGIIAYRANPLTFFIGQFIVKVPYLGITNLLLKRPYYPEFLQGKATAANLASALDKCINDPLVKTDIENGKKELYSMLSEHADISVDHWVLGFIRKNARA